MPKAKLTDFFVKNSKCSPDKIREEIFDTELPAFALRVTSKGLRSFVLYYRAGKKQRCITIGNYPTKTLKDAKDEAKEILVNLKKGKDPLVDRADTKYKLHIAATSVPNTYETMIDSFVEKYLKAKGRRTWHEIEVKLKGAPLKKWKGWEVEKITRQHVRELIEEVFDNGNKPIAANRLLAHLKRFFGWLCEKDIIESSPAQHIKMMGEETKRERFLKREEIKKFWEVCESLEYPWKQRFQLALATGMRGQEIMRMRWSDINTKENIWTIPAEDSKNGMAHDVPLSDLVLDIIESIPPMSDTYVFTTMLDKHITHNNKQTKKLYNLCKFDTLWTLHDLRRTVATFLGELGYEKDIIGRVLNHKGAFSQTDTYLRHKYLKEKAVALKAWAKELENIVSGEPHKILTLHRHPTTQKK